MYSVLLQILKGQVQKEQKDMKLVEMICYLLEVICDLDVQFGEVDIPHSIPSTISKFILSRNLFEGGCNQAS